MSPGSASSYALDIDVEHCTNCGCDLKIIAGVEDPLVVIKIRPHLGLSIRPPSLACIGKRFGCSERLE